MGKSDGKGNSDIQEKTGKGENRSEEKAQMAHRLK